MDAPAEFPGRFLKDFQQPLIRFYVNQIKPGKIAERVAERGGVHIVFDHGLG